MTDTTYATRCNDEYMTRSDARKETNDCTVRALAASTESSYDDAWQALADHGRPYRKGPKARFMPFKDTHGFRQAIRVPALEKAANDLGWKLRVMRRDEYQAKTMTTAARDPNLAKGHYIVMVRGHVAAVVNGQVIDWTKGRRHQVKEVYEMTRLANQERAKPQADQAEPMQRMVHFYQGNLFS